ncbi:O-antigen ligase family protein [Spongorhabdus nitratireducens]
MLLKKDAKISISEIDDFLRTKAIPFGLLIQFTGLLWLESSSGYITQVYIWCLLPALASIVINAYTHSTASFLLRSHILIKLIIILFSWIILHPFFLKSDFSGHEKVLTRSLYIIIYIYAVAVSVISTKKPTRLFFISATVASTFALASILFQYLVNDYSISIRMLNIGGERIHSLGVGQYAYFDNPILAALYYGVSAAFLVGFISRAPLKKAAPCLILVIPLIFFIILSDSRGPIASIAITILTAFYISKISMRTKTITVIAIALALIAAYISSDNFKQLISLARTAPEILFIRINIWDQALQQILNSPWFGYGFSSAPDIVIDQYTYNHPHNMIFKICLNWGIPAGILFIIIFITSLLICFQHIKSNFIAITICVLIFGFLGMMTDTYRFLSRPGLQWLLFFLPQGLIIGYIYRKKLQQLLLE